MNYLQRLKIYLLGFVASIIKFGLLWVLTIGLNLRGGKLNLLFVYILNLGVVSIFLGIPVFLALDKKKAAEVPEWPIIEVIIAVIAMLAIFRNSNEGYTLFAFLGPPIQWVSFFKGASAYKFKEYERSACYFLIGSVLSIPILVMDQWILIFE